MTDFENKTGLQTAFTVLAWCLHEADMCATHIDEKEGETT